ncbi:MAG: glycosyltransferase [Methanosarcina sp.]
MESPAEGVPLDIVCFSDIFWDALWQRHQQLFTRFPSNWRILFIEPTSIPVLLMQPKRLFARKYLNIEIVSLPSIPLIDRFENLRWINDSFVSLWLRFILRKKNMREPVLFYCEPRYSTLIGKLQEKMVILDYIDDKLAFSNVPSWMKIYLDNLIEKANLIFVASSYLHKSILKTRTDNVYLIGNGVDVNHFRKAMTDIPIPEDIAHIKSPIVGYVGALSDWVDFDIIRAISREYPDLSIVLVGPKFPSVKNEVDSLKQCPNIFILGAKPYEILPNYLKAFDVCIIPFKINELTLSSNPIKFYEYISTGKNVISINLPELIKYQGFVQIASNKTDFLRLVKKSLETNPDYDEIKKILDDCNWDKKAESMVQNILNYVKMV